MRGASREGILTALLLLVEVLFGLVILSVYGALLHAAFVARPGRTPPTPAEAGLPASLVLTPLGLWFVLFRRFPSLRGRGHEAYAYWLEAWIAALILSFGLSTAGVLDSPFAFLVVIALLHLGCWFLALVRMSRRAGEPLPPRTPGEMTGWNRLARFVVEVFVFLVVAGVYASIWNGAREPGPGPSPVDPAEAAWLPLVGLSPLALWFPVLGRLPSLAKRGREAFDLWGVAIVLAILVVLAIGFLSLGLFASAERRWFFLFPPAHVAMWLALLTALRPPRDGSR